MEISIIVALIAAVTAIIGWFVNAYLRRNAEDRARAIEENKETEILLREVLSICSRRSVYTRMHAQLDHGAMFNSLASCRSDLQRVLFKIKLEDDRQLVVNIISQIDLIERNKQDVSIINQAKLRIIQSLIKLSESAKVTYTLPRSLTEDIFFSVEDANKPLSGWESPASNI